jgi:hypothetical protein
MYIFTVYDRYRKGEKLSPEDKKMLAEAFAMREEMLERERKEYGTFEGRLAFSVALVAALFIGAAGIGYLSKKVGEYSVRFENYLENESKTKEGILVRDIVDWGEKSRILDNQSRYITPNEYSNKFYNLEQERLKLNERMKR